MAAQPKRKISNVQQQVRRAAKKFVLEQLGRCSHCGEATRSHRMCPSCGYYKGKPVLTIRHSPSKVTS